MSGMDVLAGLRSQIDEIDSQLMPLLERRMEIVKGVAKLKLENNIPIHDEGREQKIIDRVLENASEEYKGQASLLMRTILSLSKSQQRAALALREKPLLPASAGKVDGGAVACAYMGVPGAWHEQAVSQVFPQGERVSVEYFEDVFTAVKEGRVRYGMVALENSLTGAIGETHDLLRKYNCYIVGRTVVDIHHCLIAPAGTRLSDVAKVYSHQEGFKQCRAFLRGKGWVQEEVSNTAVAAGMAKEAGDGKTAAIGSRRAAELNGLEVLAPDIMDSATNRTTFVVIAKQPEYDEKCDRVAISFSTVHRSGALCETLLPFLAHGINMARIESRPGMGGNYRFFTELEGNILDEAMRSALNQCAMSSEYFEVLGCYPSH